MALTRREWLVAAGLIPLELHTLKPLAASRTGRADSPQIPVSPPSLPDKASFPTIRGTYLNSAATHPRSAGSTDHIKRMLAAEAGDPAGFRPSERRVRETFARLVNVAPEEIAFVPSTQLGESFVASALGLPERGAHVVSDYLHFVGSQMMYTDMQKRGVEVTWVRMKDNRIPLEDLDRAIVKGRTRLVAVSATSFVNGFQHDLKGQPARRSCTYANHRRRACSRHSTTGRR